MRRWPLSANASFFGLRRDRFTQYQPACTLDEKLARIAEVPGITGVELKYPLDFDSMPVLTRALDRSGLIPIAVNVDIKDASHFRYGALSSRSREVRAHAIGLLREGMDAAAELGASLVTTCPLADGYDYPFQINHADAWGDFVESVGLERMVTLLERAGADRITSLVQKEANVTEMFDVLTRSLAE